MNIPQFTYHTTYLLSIQTPSRLKFLNLVRIPTSLSTQKPWHRNALELRLRLKSFKQQTHPYSSDSSESKTRKSRKRRFKSYGRRFKNGHLKTDG